MRRLQISREQFILKAPQKKPIFLQVKKNLRDINFTFVRKILILEPEKEIQILLTNHEFIEMCIKGAKKYTEKKEWAKAIVAIQMARQRLDRAKKEDLRYTLKILEDKYRQALKKQRTQSKYFEATKLLSKVDDHASKLEYTKAQNALKEIKRIWPKGHYKEEYSKVIDRGRRLQVLIRQENKPLGEARKSVQKFLSFKETDINVEKLQKLHKHISTLYLLGRKDKDCLYNDLELWLKLRIHLDKFANIFGKKAQEYRKKYLETKNLAERDKIYKQYKKYEEPWRILDDWLNKFQ